MGSHSAVTTSPRGNRHLMSPAAPGFHTQGLLPWRPSPEAPPLPGRLGISEPFTSAVSLSLLLTLLYGVKYHLCGREGGRNQLSQGRRWGWRVALRDKSDSPARCEIPEACVASDMVGQAAQSFLLSLSKCLWNYEKMCVYVCVCPAFSELASSQRGINKKADNEAG